MADDLISQPNTSIDAGGRDPGAAASCRADAFLVDCVAHAHQLRRLLDAIPTPIYTTDARGRITFCNEAAEALAGRRPEIGKDEWCVTWRLYEPDGTPLPHDRCPMAVALKENRAVRGIEAVAERPDGTRVPVLPFPTPLQDAAGRLIGGINLLVDLSERKAAEQALRAVEERYRQLSRTLERSVAERTRELSDANQQLRTEAAERERVEAALRQAQTMEAIGRLASGMAHDFNNLLTAILGNLELAQTRLPDDKTRRLIAAATRAALQGARLNEQMLAFSRKQHLAPRPVDLNALIADMSDRLRRTFGDTVRLEIALAYDLWLARADLSKIELVIGNLAINARDALPGGGIVRVATRNVAAAEAGTAAALAPGDYVCIAVSDNGTGMPAPILARACEPFFTTKEPGCGSGLGLPQAYGVVRQSGGDIAIRSAVGSGTTVEVYLPRSTEEAAPVDSSSVSSAHRATPRTQTILVVDDQPDVREVAVAHLVGLGYRVMQAPNGRAALGLLGNGDAVDLLIADYAMAEMNGIELAHAARQRCPDLPIVMLTAYVEAGAIDRAIPGAALLKKPYRLADLTATVAGVLRGERKARETTVATLPGA